MTDTPMSPAELLGALREHKVNRYGGHGEPFESVADFVLNATGALSLLTTWRDAHGRAEREKALREAEQTALNHQLAEAKGYAQRLAQALHRKHYSDITQWRVDDDLLIVLTQIENMTSGLVHEAALAEKDKRIGAGSKLSRAVYAYLSDEIDGASLKDAFEQFRAALPAAEPAEVPDSIKRANRYLNSRTPLAGWTKDRDDLAAEFDAHTEAALSARPHAASPAAHISPPEDKGACPVCGCEEVDHRNLWTCRCPASTVLPRWPNERASPAAPDAGVESPYEADGELVFPKPKFRKKFKCLPIAEFEAREAELASLRAQLTEVSNAIGTVEFMDPPDGGDVSLAEQVRRMRAALAEKDKRIAELEALLDRAYSSHHGDPHAGNPWQDIERRSALSAAEPAKDGG